MLRVPCDGLALIQTLLWRTVHITLEAESFAAIQHSGQHVRGLCALLFWMLLDSMLRYVDYVHCFLAFVFFTFRFLKFKK